MHRVVIRRAAPSSVAATRWGFLADDALDGVGGLRARASHSSHSQALPRSHRFPERADQSFVHPQDQRWLTRRTERIQECDIESTDRGNLVVRLVQGDGEVHVPLAGEVEPVPVPRLAVHGSWRVEVAPVSYRRDETRHIVTFSGGEQRLLAARRALGEPRG